MGDSERIVKLEVTLGRIFFPKEAKKVTSGEFAIFVANIEKVVDGGYENTHNTIKLKGKVCALETGNTYSVTAKLVEVSDKFGETWEIIFINRKVELISVEEQKTFLNSILNANVAQRLFETFGEQTINLLESEDVKSLCTVKGIGAKMASKLIQTYKDSKDYSAIYTKLSGYEFTPTMIKKLVEHYNSPDTVVEKIQSNPYSLIEVSGIGFKKVDEIALGLNMGRENPNRIKGFLYHYLEQEAELGKSYLSHMEIINKAGEILGDIDFISLDKIVAEMVAQKILLVSHEGTRVGLNKYFDLEMNIAKEIKRLRDSESLEFNTENWEEIIKGLEKRQGWEYTEEQKNGVGASLKSNIVILTAKAGAGKTTIANGICEILKNYKISQCALSGKASVRMVEATGREASTIHKLLEYNPSVGYGRNEENPLDADIVIVDECSMINGEMFFRLLKAIKSGAKVILLGDIAQLTSIGSCNVFSDLIASEFIPVIRLTKVHRQGAESGILSTSLKISDREQVIGSKQDGVVVFGKLKDMEIQAYQESAGLDQLVVQNFLAHYNRTKDINAVQVIVPLRLRGEISTYELNNKIQALINNPEGKTSLSCSMGKEKPFRIVEGDKVLNTKNNYKAVNEDGEKVAIFNGSTGIVKEVWENGCVVEFTGLDTVILDKAGIECLELGYAMTVHKCQGSQSEVVITALDNSAYILLNCELLYTAMTRAKKYCVLVGQTSAIRSATKNVEGEKKQTYLQDIFAYLM